jgi:hypothetical protein
MIIAGSLTAAVHLPMVPRLHNQNQQNVVLNIAEGSIVTDPVAPQPGQIPSQLACITLRIAISRQSLGKFSFYASGYMPVYLAQLPS